VQHGTAFQFEVSRPQKFVALAGISEIVQQERCLLVPGGERWVLNRSATPDQAERSPSLNWRRSRSAPRGSNMRPTGATSWVDRVVLLRELLRTGSTLRVGSLQGKQFAEDTEQPLQRICTSGWALLPPLSTLNRGLIPSPLVTCLAGPNLASSGLCAGRWHERKGGARERVAREKEVLEPL